ncbi:MAG: RNA-binding domain-containing protein [Nitrososphaerota archaeon]|nr:RNA-binding domain-containing protein [Nitrososphaerota archaeon]
MKISSIEISFIVHATEDEEKVLESIVKRLSIPREIFKVRRMEGHFGNPIQFYHARLTGNEADRFAERLFPSLDDIDKDLMRIELKKYIDEHGNLYLRIDKQTFFDEKGKLRLSQEDAVRIKLKFKEKQSLNFLNKYLKNYE